MRRTAIRLLRRLLHGGRMETLLKVCDLCVQMKIIREQSYHIYSTITK